RRPGLILGWFLFGTFTARIFIEKLKFVQEAWELKWVDTIGLNQGQILSIPFIIAGLALIIYALRRPALEVAPLPKKKEN
ncbi:prolipoprotein diacylglyceryl transferase family protein, partial [Porphyromonas sp.]